MALMRWSSGTAFDPEVSTGWVEAVRARIDRTFSEATITADTLEVWRIITGDRSPEPQVVLQTETREQAKRCAEASRLKAVGFKAMLGGVSRRRKGWRF